MYIKVIGDNLSGTEYFISTDNGETYQQVSLETKTGITAGNQLRLKIELNSASTLIDSVAVLYI